jgi:hypothetical protein
MSGSPRSLALLLATVGCASDYTSLHGGDRTFFPLAAASFELKPPHPDRASSTLALDVEAFATGGEDDLELAPGEHAVLDGRDFVGPAQADVEWNAIDVAVDLRSGIRFPWGGRLEGLLGIEGSQVDVELGNASEDFLEIGPVYGIQFSWEFVEHVALVGRWQEYFGVLGGWDDAFSGKVEHVRAGLECDAIPHVGLFAGWMWWLYRRVNDHESDVRLRLNGPAAGLRFRF